MICSGEASEIRMASNSLTSTAYLPFFATNYTNLANVRELK
jgi:hypothetical protein